MEIDGDLLERRELQKGEPSNPWLTPELCKLSVRLTPRILGQEQRLEGRMC